MTTQEVSNHTNQSTTIAVAGQDQQTRDPIRIYVACLAAYNNGILHGAWIDADQDADTIGWAIWDMLKASPIDGAEEWAIHDFVGFGRVSISEYEGIEAVAAKASFIAEHGAFGAALLDHFSSDLDDARTAIEDQYAGEHASLADFARELTEERGEIPDYLAFYIDYEAMARDLVINDVFTVETGFEEVHIFWSH